MKSDGLSYFIPAVRNWFLETFENPTKVQEEAWPAIRAGEHVLVSAPTGTGKTLTAFLVFLNQLMEEKEAGRLEEKLYVIYISPLKSLAGDIRENLKRPLEGTGISSAVRVAVRTGDTPQSERQRMGKHPPHILITTPESLYLMLTGRLGQAVLKTAQAVIVDELHALIDTKRGAHLMLSLARLDSLCGRPLQRIGLSATIEPLSLAAEYLAPEKAVVIAPVMEKQMRITVVGTIPPAGVRRDPVWEELSREVYARCLSCQSVIAFCEGRRYAEKLAYYVNLLGGEGFARVHHGSLSKEQRMEVEQALREGSLRLLCATSSMELGIDVGEIDQVLQVGCPRTVSSTMQRLGRAGHGPGRISVMYMYPRTAAESIQCAMTAKMAGRGGVEWAKPPRLCLDVLAQHLVSMAATGSYHVDDVLKILPRAYPFVGVSRKDVKEILAMLAGDYEHDRELPVRPRVLYDRIHETVTGDVYSRMLAVAAGGTIPDKGLYLAKSEDGVILGELDEEFVYETRIGDKILLGSFGWRVIRQDRDTVILAPSGAEGGRLPFWKGEIKGRSFRTSQAFGRILRSLEEAGEAGKLTTALAALGMDDGAAETGAGFLERQMAATGCLPTDKTILVEHFTDHTGCSQLMVHSLFGRRVNGPLALLLQETVRQQLEIPTGCVEEEDGFLLYPYGKERLPEGLLYRLDPERARGILEALLPVTPLFSLSFRYNAGRALMMGMRRNGRTPLWLQRLRSTRMMDSLINKKEHPLIRETVRECLEDYWDLQGVEEVLGQIRSGRIALREVHTETPSPMSLPFQWRIEAEEMYAYTPSTTNLQHTVYENLRQEEMLRPSAEVISQVQKTVHRRQPEDENGLHALLLMEGDMTAEELRELDGMSEERQEPDRGPQERLQRDGTPEDGRHLSKWLESLAGQQRIRYLDLGLWIAGEHQGEYVRAFAGENDHGSKEQEEAACHILRRQLYYRGGQTKKQLALRYGLSQQKTGRLLECLCGRGEVVEESGIYYHARLYEKARKAEIRERREDAVTMPSTCYAALLAEKACRGGAGEERLLETLREFCDCAFPAAWWENMILARRVKNYRESMLDQVLAQGEFFWQMLPGGELCFHRYEAIDWNAPLPPAKRMEPESEQAKAEEELYGELLRRGASFAAALPRPSGETPTTDGLLRLAEQGRVCADSFLPVRQCLKKDRLAKAAVRQRVGARVKATSAGRWDVVRPVRPVEMEEWLERQFDKKIILCRETFERPAGIFSEAGPDWSAALEKLRIWEYTGRVRRGYFVRGMSGVQFIRSTDYAGVTQALQLSQMQDKKDVVWLHASDPAMAWGRELPHEKNREFMRMPGTAVALYGGLPVLAWERQGRVLRILGDDGQNFPVEQAIERFVNHFQSRRLFAKLKRLTVKEYPPGYGEKLKEAGFRHEMQDYVLYR